MMPSRSLPEALARFEETHQRRCKPSRNWSEPQERDGAEIEARRSLIRAIAKSANRARVERRPK